MIVIYTTAICPYCKLAKEYFKNNNIKFIEKDIESDESALREMIDKSHQMGVPVILIGDEVVVGFDREKIEEALKKQ